MASGKHTHYALIARGLDSRLAASIVERGTTFGELKRKSDKQLKQLGLSVDLVKTIRAEKRPPIPIETVVRLLYESRSTCCVCRRLDAPVVIHHIVEWEKSHNHDECNLVVLCPNDHAQAHSHSSLSQNLTPTLLRRLKAEWVKTVETHDAQAIVRLASKEAARWDYINHQRLFELARSLQVDPTDNKHFARLKAMCIVDRYGILNGVDQWRVERLPNGCLYMFGGNTQLYLYTSDLLNRVLSRLPVADITGLWDRTEVNSVAKPGRWISLDGAYYFKRIPTKNDGHNQNRSVYRQANRIRLNFEIDAWDATSMSAHSVHLSGRTVHTAICLVRDVEQGGPKLLIKSSCLAIGTHFEKLEVTGLSKIMRANPKRMNQR